MVISILLLMGTVFPIALRQTQPLGPSRMSWFWAINGAMSIVGSVLATTVAFANGIHATYLTGAALYLGAGLLFFAAERTPIA